MTATAFYEACRDSITALIETLTAEDQGHFEMAVSTCWKRSNQAAELWPAIEHDWPAVGEPTAVAWIVAPRAAEAALLILQEGRLAFDGLDEIPRAEHRTAFQDAFREWHGWPRDRFEAIRARAFLLAKIQAEFEAYSQAQPDETRDLPATTAAIFAFLKQQPKGVSFSEFVEARHPVTRHRFTESRDVESIASMLRKHSQNLSAIGYQIRVALKANRIELVKRNSHE